MSRRVVQWTTGSVGRRAARAVLRHPDLELAGVFAYGPDKVGRAAAELPALKGKALDMDGDSLIN